MTPSCKTELVHLIQEVIQLYISILKAKEKTPFLWQLTRAKSNERSTYLRCSSYKQPPGSTHKRAKQKQASCGFVWLSEQLLWNFLNDNMVSFCSFGGWEL